MSFVVGADSGLAFICARNEKDAMRILQNSGRYNGTPEAYKAIQIRDIGMSSSMNSELLLESYVNALVAYDAIYNAVKIYTGPQGPEGKSAYQIAREHGYRGTEEEWLEDIKGDKGDTGAPAGFGQLRANILNPLEIGTPSVVLNSDGPDTAKNMEFVFRNLRGQTGPQGATGPMVPTVNNLNNEMQDGTIAPSTYALSSAQGPVIKTMFDTVNARVDGAVFVGSTVESWSDTEPDTEPEDEQL